MPLVLRKVIPFLLFDFVITLWMYHVAPIPYHILTICEGCLCRWGLPIMPANCLTLICCQTIKLKLNYCNAYFWIVACSMFSRQIATSSSWDNLCWLALHRSLWHVILVADSITSITDSSKLRDSPILWKINQPCKKNSALCQSWPSLVMCWRPGDKITHFDTSNLLYKNSHSLSEIQTVEIEMSCKAYQTDQSTASTPINLPQFSSTECKIDMLHKQQDYSQCHSND